MSFEAETPCLYDISIKADRKMRPQYVSTVLLLRCSRVFDGFIVSVLCLKHELTEEVFIVIIIKLTPGLDMIINLITVS